MISTITQILPTGVFSTSGTKTEPDISTRVSGMAENQGLPYEYWNYYLNMFTSNTNTIDTAVNAVITELDNLLAAAGITIVPATHTQVTSAVNYLISNPTAVIHSTNTTDSTLYNNGSVVLDGGMGIAKALTVKGKCNFVRGATIVIASSDSQTNSQYGADTIISTGSDAGAAINALIIALNAAGGGSILLMEGTYNIETNILPLSNVNISGCGIRTILKRHSSSLYQVIYIASGVTNAVLQDFYVNGNGGTYPISGSTCYGIYCQTVNTNPYVFYYNIYVGSNVGDSQVTGFQSCCNMINCTSNGNRTTANSQVQGFNDCWNVSNCSAYANLTTVGYAWGFLGGGNYTNCEATSNSGGTGNYGCGFEGAVMLTNCHSNSNTGTNTGTGYGYISCIRMQQNTGTGNKTALIGSACFADSSSNAAGNTAAGGYNL
jgi:hypothetical protein